MNLGDGHSRFECIPQEPNSLVIRPGELGPNLLARWLLGGVPAVLAVATETKRPHLQPSQRLLERFLEGAADGHRLADAFHLRGEHRVGFREFFEREPWNLGHHVIDRRLETGPGLARDVVRQLVQAVAHGQLGRDLGDRESGGLAGQGAGTADARIHFDHDHPSVLRIDRKLNVRSAGLHPDLANHGQCRVAHPLIFLVR